MHLCFDTRRREAPTLQENFYQGEFYNAVGYRGFLLKGQCHEQILLLLFIVKELKKHPVQVLYLFVPLSKSYDLK